MPCVLRYLKWINFFFDILILNLSLLAAYYLCFGSNVVLLRQALPYALIINMGWVFIQAIFKLYDNYLYRNSISIYYRTIKVFIFFCFCLSVVFSLSMQNDLFVHFLYKHIFFYAAFLVFFAAGLFLGRLVLLIIRKSNRQKANVKRKNIVIVGQSPSSRTLSQLFTERAATDYNIIGIFHDDHQERFEGDDAGLYLGNAIDCIPFMRNNKVDELFCTLPGVSKEKVDMLMHEADRNLTRFRLVPDYYEYFPGTASIEMIDNIPVITGRNEPLENIQNAIFKRLFDIFFSLFVIVFVLSWLYPIIAILIKLESKGPVLFRQKRSGRSNEPFHCLKFRSMTVNDNADKQQATKNDKRITKVGAFLRKTSLDELPQFINVLIGNMSVIGPRPHMLSHTEQYSALIDKFMVRHFLKPGITGWAQVNGHRGETRTIDDMAKRVEADVWYLEHWSFLLDMKIIFLTVYNILKGEKNAY